MKKKKLRPKTQIKREYRGIKIIGGLMIIGAVYRLNGLISFENYKFMFQPLTGDALLMRYAGSLTLRVIAILIGFGVFFKREVFRRLAIYLCCFTIAIQYFKHPFQVFKNIAIYHEHHVTDTLSQNYSLTYPYFPWISMSFYYAVDIIFCSIAIYYLSRQEIKNQFK